MGRSGEENIHCAPTAWLTKIGTAESWAGYRVDLRKQAARNAGAGNRASSVVWGHTAAIAAVGIPTAPQSAMPYSSAAAVLSSGRSRAAGGAAAELGLPNAQQSALLGGSRERRRCRLRLGEAYAAVLQEPCPGFGDHGVKASPGD